MAKYFKSLRMDAYLDFLYGKDLYLISGSAY